MSSFYGYLKLRNRAFREILSAILLVMTAFLLPTASFALDVPNPQLNHQPTTSSQSNQSLYALFSKSSPQKIYQIEYTDFDLFLSSIVMNFGPSERQVPYDLGRFTGTRLRFGHRGKTALEGNRIMFSLFTEENRQRLTYLREYQEKLSEIVDFEKLTRDQQLAFWLNLYNISMIEQIALQYPMIYPTKIRIGPEKQPLLDAKVTQVRGIRLSLRDIQERIVYVGWQDPRVIYGFFTGMAGGPNIRPFAFTGDHVWKELHANATEFVNSLRGVRMQSNKILVSQLYGDSSVFFVNSSDDLPNHLRQFAKDEVMGILNSHRPMKIGTYYSRIADLSGGSLIKTATMNSVTTTSASHDLPIRARASRGFPPHALRLREKVHKKFGRLYKKGLLPTVTVSDDYFLKEDAPRYQEMRPGENENSATTELSPEE